MKLKNILSVLLIAILILPGLSSCNSKSKKSGNKNEKNIRSQQIKPSSIGGTDEVLVVLQNDQQWKGTIGKTIKKYMAAPQYGLPQPEPKFKLLHVTEKIFNDMFKKQRNIIVVNIDPKVTRPSIRLRADVWAAPQLVFTITAPSSTVFEKVFSNNNSVIMRRFQALERQRIIDVFKTSLDVKLIEKIKKQFGFTLDVPTGFYIAKTDPGFMWIRHEASMYSQGILIISVPYVDTAQFSRESILNRIQNYQRRFIPGPTNGSYMALDRKFEIPHYKITTNFPTKYAAEIIGLWRVEHDFMGGPFVSYTFLDHKTNEIVTLFGYVYYPNHNKRNILLQVQSILYSISFKVPPVNK